MSLDTLTVVLGNSLENLKKEDFERFCTRLLDRRKRPRVATSRVEGKSRLEVTGVMVSTFTEAEAWRVAVEILRSIDCGAAAQDLEEEADRVSSASGSGSGSGSTSSASGSAEAQHFVDRFRLDLTTRVTNVEPILDLLLSRDLIKPERYDEIRKLPTRPAQMRELYSGPLKAGRKSKDIFYEILEDQEQFLMDELKERL